MKFRRLVRLIHSDLFRYEGKCSFRLFAKSMIMNSGFIATFHYRVMRYLFLNNFKILLIPYKLLYRVVQYFLGFEISYQADIGPGLSFVHVTGTFISENVKIGKNLNLCHGVTIGSTPRGLRIGYPIIGDNVFVAPGSKIIGQVNIGSFAAVGANAVVTKDMPEYAVAAGIPAEIISYKGSDGYIQNTNYYRSTKVLHIISSLEVGGAEKLLVSLLSASTEHSDIQYIVVVMNDRLDDVLARDLSSIGYSIYFLNRKESHKHPRYLLALLGIIKNHQVEVVHTHDSGSKYWALLCKLINPGLKLVTTIHTTQLVSKYGFIDQLISRHLISINIAISKAVENECLQTNFTNCMMIYNGIDTESFFKHRRNKKNDATRSFTIINIARFDYHKKGQDILLHALKLCREMGLNFHCQLVGVINQNTLASYEHLVSLIKTLGLEEQVELLVNRDDIPELLVQSDLFILPSRNEGFGLVIVEAMAAGTPVLASDIEGPLELIQHGVSGLLFPVGNIDVLARLIADIIQKSIDTSEIIERASVVSKQFDIYRMSESYAGLYRDLTSSSAIFDRDVANTLFKENVSPCVRQTQ